MPIEIITRLGAITARIEQTFEYTAYEDLPAGCVVCIDETTGRVRKAKADSWTTMPAIGVTKNAVNANDTVEIYQFGIVRNILRDADFNKDDTIFVSATTAGNASKTPPQGIGNLVQSLGRAINASDIVLQIDQTIIELKEE